MVKGKKIGTRLALILVTIYHFVMIYILWDRTSIVWFELPVLAILAVLAFTRRIDSALALCFLVVCMFLLAEPAMAFGYVICFAIIPYFFLLDREKSYWILAAWGLWTGMLIAAGDYTWIWRAVMVFFEFGALAAFPLFLIFTFLVGVQHGIFLALARFLRDRLELPFILIVPGLYTVIEFWMPLPMPMALSGHFAYNPFFIQLLDIIGMQGVSLLIALFSAALYSAFCSFRLHNRKHLIVSIFFALSILGFDLMYGIYCFAHYKDDPASPSLDIAMIQPVSPLKVRNTDTALQERIAEDLKRLSLETIAAKKDLPDLLIWPEGAAAFASRTPQFNPPYMRAIIDIQKATSATLLVQDVEFTRNVDDSRIRYYSSASMILPVGKTGENYRKNILMPFGEYLPMEEKFPILRKIFSEARTILPGKEVFPIQGPGGDFAALICYEVIFPDYVRRYVGKGCGYIVNLTNDRWYGVRQQPLQHQAMTVLRAIENRKPIVRSTNSGISAFIDARGVIAPGMQTRPMEKCFLRGKIHPRKGISFFSRHGDILHRWLLTPVYLFLLLYAWMKRNSFKASPIQAKKDAVSRSSKKRD